MTGKATKKHVKVISDGSIKGIKVMMGDVDLIGELHIKSVKWSQEGNDEPIVFLEIYAHEIDAKGELFAEIIDEGDANKNGNGKG